tara:strand:+ start:4009 stop:4881 length:873 start_codon:yes stop_codon:yes gene_type:complete
VNDTNSLFESAKLGDRRALARLLSLLEEGHASPVETGIGDSIGVTGPPGVGKSTLIGKLIDEWLSRGETVAVLAIDPSSPQTGGALLGDRMRMMNADSSDSVYVRSLATRNHPGGLMDCLTPMVDVLCACGWQHVVLETVGAGQSEIRVVAFADRIILVDGPDRGDVVQAEKAGIMELADMIVINKSDLPNAQRAAEAVKSALSAGSDTNIPDVLLVSAHNSTGISELVDSMSKLESSQDRERLRIRERLISAWDSMLLTSELLDESIHAIETGSMTLRQAVEHIRDNSD